MAFGFLLGIFTVAPSFGAGTGAGASESGSSPLFDYRYNQAAEQLGLLGSGASDSELGYGSIQTESLNADEKLTVKSSDSIDIDDPIPDITSSGCQDIPTMGKDTCSATCIGTCGSRSTCRSTCQDSCGDTCAGTCGSTCGSTCAASCGSTCTNTCADSCGSTCGSTCMASCGSTCTNTCANSCGSTCANTCAASCGSTCINTCASTCGSTCRNTCAASCGSTCINTCVASCGSTCSRTCAGSCGYTCYSTCRSSCGYTCANTCGSTCSYSTCSYTCAGTCRSTCSYTCASTCSATCTYTCINTCSATCGAKCVTPVMPVVNAPVADFSTKAPPVSEQNVLMQYDTDFPTPDYVYYKSVNTKWSTFRRSFAENYLLGWIKTQDNSWNVVARTPVRSWVIEVAFVPVSGDLTVSSISPSGLTDSRTYRGVTPGYRYMWFYAPGAGTYASVFNIGGIKSNQITLYAY